MGLVDRTFMLWSRWRPFLEAGPGPAGDAAAALGAVAAAIAALTAAAFVLLLLAVADGPRPGPAGRAALLAASAALLLFVEHRSAETFAAGETTDTLAFTEYAAGLVLEGRNPYPASMTPALARVPEQFRTRLTDARTQVDYPYPGLHVLLFVPGEALGLGPRATTLAASLALLGLLAAPPAERSIVGTAALLASSTLLPFSVGGTSDVVWAALLAAAAAVWRKPAARAVLVGLAMAYKQAAWVAAPFLLIRVLCDEGRPAAVRFAGLAAAASLPPQAPFLLADPAVYVANVSFIATGDLRAIGAGPSLLAPFVGLAYPKALGLAATAVCLAAAWASPRLRGPAVWLLPPLALLFWHRFLHPYLVFFLPALVADLLRDAPRAVFPAPPESQSPGRDGPPPVDSNLLGV